ncbi:H/ACA ribonucleoprotein complex subunit 2-like protein [Amphiura filiformis]|uniref:H/ACA ribonucleoprotein complex subunit 2-like protein n=1 Tax=Amphiura filiformis TaxID=82378 RepID=UPI003B21916B
MGKTPKKDQGETAEETTDGGITYEQQLELLNSIANPLASKKLTKRIYKTIKKASSNKSLRTGIKEVQKYLRKGEKGFVVIAGDVTPIEVVCHLPAVCEELEIPYAYVPSKKDLGSAFGCKRTSCCVLVKRQDDFASNYDECMDQIKTLPPPI